MDITNTGTATQNQYGVSMNNPLGTSPVTTQLTDSRGFASPSVVSNYNTQSKVNDINKEFQNNIATQTPQFPTGTRTAVYAPTEGTGGMTGDFLGYASNEQERQRLMESSQDPTYFGTDFTAPQDAQLQPDGTYLYQGQNYTKDQLSSPENLAAISNTSRQQKKYDQALQSQLDAINKRFDMYKQQQQAVTQSTAAGAQNALLQSGAGGRGSVAQYASVTADARVNSIMAEGAKELQELDSKRDQLLSEAQIAYQDKDYKLLGDLNTQITKNRDDMLEVSRKASEALALETKNAKKDSDIAMAYEEVGDDPIAIYNKLKEKGVKNVTLKDVKDTVDIISNKVQEEKDKVALQGLLKSVSENGTATPAQIAHLAKSKDVDDFYAQGGGDFLSSTDYKYIEMPDGSTIQIDEKTGEEIRRFGDTPKVATGENKNAMAYARQYAIDGKLPSLTDLQKLGTSPDEITRMAKELPKQKGELLSTQTGVKPTNISAAAQEDFVRLYNITQNIARLKKLDDERVGGLVSGTLGKVFGSSDQAAYLAARKNIVDDLARMQSGAALTQDEVQFYQEYLPGRFSEFMGLGVDSMDRINNFETEMNNKLNNSLANNALSIYGYSTVNLGGKDYKVGEEVEVNGVKGRVLPDGQVSVKEKPISVIEIPKTSRLSSVNNNPGNLRFAGQQGAVKGEGGFAKFPTPEAGVKALENQIKLDTGRGLTLSQFINKFAPPSENDTNNYIKVVANATSSSPTTKLAQIDIKKLLRAIANHESGTKIT